MMIESFRHSAYLKVLWGLLGLFLLNISVDSPDAQPLSNPEDLSINDQESLIEIFIEKILGLKNAIAEFDDHDADDHKKEKKNKIDLVGQPSFQHCKTEDIVKFQLTGFSSFSRPLSTGYYQLNTPPPEA